MTKTFRTLDQIDANIAFVTKGINQLEASTEWLRAQLGQDDRAYVVGWPNGLFLACEGHISGLRFAKLFPGVTAANVACSRVFNGKGERAIAISYDGAIDLTLRLNGDTLKLLNDCLHGLYEERNEWEDMERAADEAAYYDGLRAAIVTEFIYPPIPIRDFDWSACRDGYEPGDAQGYGRTQEEAIADLLAIEEERA